MKPIRKIRYTNKNLETAINMLSNLWYMRRGSKNSLSRRGFAFSEWFLYLYEDKTVTHQDYDVYPRLKEYFNNFIFDL